MPTTLRTLAEIAGGEQRPLNRMTVAANAARRSVWAQVTARHGALPAVRVADKRLDGVTPVGEPLRIHTDAVWAVAVDVLPDGTAVIVSRGEDRTVRCGD